MQDASPALQSAVQGDYTKVDRVKLTHAGVVTHELGVSSGSVDAVRDAEQTRRFTADVPIPAELIEELVPYDLDDPTAPFGREVIIETGARLSTIIEDSLVADTAADWNAGTRDDTVVVGGSLVLGYT